MTKEELNILISEPYTHFVYSDKDGIIATMRARWMNGPKIVNVPIGSAGIIESVNENSIIICWDHYDFEDHKIQELLPNPVSILNFENLDLIRKNRYSVDIKDC